MASARRRLAEAARRAAAADAVSRCCSAIRMAAAVVEMPRALASRCTWLVMFSMLDDDDDMASPRHFFPAIRGRSEFKASPPSVRVTTMELLPADAWALIGGHLGGVDVRALALACPRLLPDIGRILGARRVRVWQGTCETVLAHWREHVTDVEVLGPAALAACARYPVAPLALPSLPALRRLCLRRPRCPPDFWRTAFEVCPVLDEVDLECDIRRKFYEEDVRHVVDLVVHGAPRLRRLRVHSLGPARLAPSATAVGSATLREYVALCPQAPVPVACSLDVLETDARDLDRLLVPGASVDRVVVHVREDMMACLRALPPSLRALEVRIEQGGDGPPWGPALAHVTALTELRLRMTAPPVGERARDLVDHWLGVGPAIRAVSATFSEPATYALEQAMDELAGEEGSEEFEQLLAAWHEAAKLVPADGLRRWMDAHPLASVHVENFAALLAPPNI